VAPFAAARMRLWLTKIQRFGCGHDSWLRWSVGTKRVPTALFLTGHPPNVGLHSPTALARISLHSMVFALFSHRVGTSFLRLRKPRLPARQYTIYCELV
jgi:hypothetical protein